MKRQREKSRHQITGELQQVQAPYGRWTRPYAMATGKRTGVWLWIQVTIPRRRLTFGHAMRVKRTGMRERREKTKWLLHDPPLFEMFPD